MGKRPYYILFYTTEYDGYNTEIVYIGSNFKAAKERYRALYDYIYDRDFIQQGVEPDRIDATFRQAPDDKMTPGQHISSWLNDQNETYDSVHLMCLNTGIFSGRGEMTHLEELYQMNHPNAKY